MPAGKKDGRSEADNASEDCLRIFSRQRYPLDRLAGQDQPSALFPGQNRAKPRRAYSLARTFEFAIRCACCSTSPIQELASCSRVAPGAQAAAALLSTSDGYKVAGSREN